jgi:hypothetical protein
MITRGTLPAKRMGKSWILRKSDVERVRAAREVLRGTRAAPSRRGERLDRPAAKAPPR